MLVSRGMIAALLAVLVATVTYTVLFIADQFQSPRDAAVREPASTVRIDYPRLVSTPLTTSCVVQVRG